MRGLGWVPVLGVDDQAAGGLGIRDGRGDRRHDVLGATHVQRPGGVAEIVLHVDDDQGVIGTRR
jgi:hypothetical protein